MENSNQKNILMGILAYLSILVIIPYLVAKDEPFVKFHIRQGLVLLAIEVVLWILVMIFWPLIAIAWIVKLVLLVFMVLGIINVVQGREKELPLVGSYAKYFNI